MARGWESKAIESQIEEAYKQAFDKTHADEVTAESRARAERLESLRLSRARTLSQLESAIRAAHREMLQKTLRALEAEIEDLNREI